MQEAQLVHIFRRSSLRGQPLGWLRSHWSFAVTDNNALFEGNFVTSFSQYILKWGALFHY